MQVLVAGASGGIGMALLREIVRRHPSASIVGTWHKTPPRFEAPGLTWVQADMTDETQVAELTASLDYPNWVINAVGMLHSAERGPEKSLRHLEEDFFMDNIRVNTLPTLLLAKHLNRRMCRDDFGVFATVSARVGSIADNRLGGWTSYRCAKAALNMALKNISIEWSRTAENIAVVSLHPGTTDTYLSKPFQASVNPDKLFPPSKTAGLLLDVMEGLTPAHSGCFLAYDGTAIPW